MESKFIANGAVPSNGNVDIVADGAARKKLYRNSLTLATLNEFDDFDEEKEDQIDGPKRILAVLVPLTAYINKRPSDQSYAHTEGTMSNGVSITTLEDVGSLTSGQSMKALDYPLPLEVIDKLSRNHRLYNIIIDSNPKLLTGKTLSNELHYNTIQPDSKVASEIKQSIKQAKQDEEERRIKRKRSSEEEEQAKLESTDLNSPPENQVKPDRPLSADLTLTTITTPKLKHLHKAFSIDCERGTIEHGKPKLVKNYSVESEKGIVEPVASVSKVHHDSRCKSMSPPGNLGRQHRSDSTPWLRRQFSFKEHPTHYLKHLKVHRNSVMYRGAALTTPSYRLRASSCPNIYRNSITTIAKDSETNWMDDARELLATMFDFSMFLELHFFLVSVSTILLFTWFVIPYFYLTDFVTNRGLSKEEATSILSYIGVTNTIGMVVLGWACDQPWLNVKKTYAVCLIGCGLSTVMMPFFATNYYALLVTCLSFGVFFASNFSCTPIILVELVPLDRFATAYGLTLLAQGIGNLVGPPLAGWVFDVTQVWDYSFFLAGFWIVISGVLIAIIPFTENKIIWGSGTLEMDREDLSV
uniref:Monocarboxylate transporter 14 n=1 Tax=Cacopsylla melanoneura TaxID=428564 RepID=A0A8D8TUN4_9HEMI